MNGSERLRTVALGTTTMAALAGAGVSAYLWARAFTGGAELVVRPPSVDIAKEEVVPALIAVAEPRRQAHRPVRATRVVRAVGPTSNSAASAPRAIPISRPSSPKPAPKPPTANPGTPSPAPAPTPQPTPQPAPTAPSPGPAAPSPAPAPSAGPSASGGTPAAVPSAPPVSQPPAQPAQDDDRKQAKRRKEQEGATPAQPAIPPRPQDQKPPPAATPAVPAVPPSHAGNDDEDRDRGDDGHGRGKRP